jgi:3-methyladenine DNA glycosylase AlkC
MPFLTERPNDGTCTYTSESLVVLALSTRGPGQVTAALSTPWNLKSRILISACNRFSLPWLAPAILVAP